MRPLLPHLPPDQDSRDASLLQEKCITLWNVAQLVAHFTSGPVNQAAKRVGTKMGTKKDCRAHEPAVEAER